MNRAGDKVLTLLIIDTVAVSHRLKIEKRLGITNAFLSVVRHALR